MRYRTGLLLGAAFLAGVTVARPAWRLTDGSFGVTQARAGEGAGHGETYRLLTLFGDVFERVRADYVDPVSSKKLIYNALNGMLSGLDPHSSYMDPQQWRDMQVQMDGQFGGVGMEVTEFDGLLKVISPIDGTPAARAGLKPGDLITALDGKTVEGLTLSQAVNRIRGKPGTTVTLTIKREHIDTPIKVTLTRQIIHIQVVKSHLYGDIGYVRLAEFDEDTAPGLAKAIAAFKKQDGDKLRGIILDLRNNPGGLLDQAVRVADDFLNGGEIVSTKGRHADDDHQWYATPGDVTGGLPVVVMINDGSASASEIVSGALQDNHRAALLGTRSFGKGSVQTVIPLPGNGAIRLTTARYYTPDGRSIQGLGITPDVVVHEFDTRQATFGPDHESQLNNTISNSGGAKVPPSRIHTKLPVAAKEIPAKPPKNWPKFDPADAATDFQLHEALFLVRAMAAEHPGGAVEAVEPIRKIRAVQADPAAPARPGRE